MVSPVAGTIQEVYFRVGEMVQPGRPIVSILPPDNVKVRFFVPQATLPSIHIGDRVLVRCDGCRDDLVARVSFISAQAEFTPPVIYSLEERARLVFRIEALPERPGDLRIGQPASVALQSAPCQGQSMPRNDNVSVGSITDSLYASGAAARNGEYAIDVEGLTKSFDGKEVVRNLSLRVRRGQIYGFLGPNGSGKTTTLRMICGLLTPDGGRGTCLGYDILTERERSSATSAT